MALGQQARSFGGYFLDGAGAVVVYVADTTEFATARAAVEALLGTDALGLPPSARPARVEVRNGDFSFQQLSDWRDIVSDSLLGQPDVIFDDADEARNRVTIGLDRQNYAAAESQVTASLSRLGIPLNAIHFEPAGRITLATSNTLDTLADSVAGGALIVTGTQSGSAIGSCSLGPVADSVGVLVFFTASHCTSAEYALDHSIASFWTQDVGFPYTKLIGTESGDPVPEGYMCHGWPFNQYCDWSARSTDAALFHIASGSHVRRGLMARPSQRVTHQAGPRSLDSAHPWLYVVRTATAVSGQWVDHIGEKTGWNYGQVTNTCVDFGSYNEYQQANFGAFCQVMTDFYTDHGDSGGPVFAWDGRDGATLLGIVVGKDDQGYSYFSSYAEILSDFGFGAGVINATTGTSLGAMTISGSVSGSNPVPSWSTPTVTNGNSGATTYAVYRATFDGTTGQFTEPEEVITGAYVGNQWLDLERTATQYVGTTRPPVRTSYVSYRVVAYNTGVSAQTSTVYFTTN